MSKLALGPVLLAASVALADKLPPPPASKPARTGGGEDADLKPLVGTWSCAGTSRGPTGGSQSYKARLVLKWDQAGNWLAVHREMQLPHPGPAFASDGWLGWDTAGKRYWLVGVNNEGGWVELTAASWDGPSLVLTGEGASDGKRTPLRFTFTRGKTDKDLLFAAEAQLGGSRNWMLTTQDTCKR